MQNSKSKGEISEAKCLARFLEKGWRVYLPFGDNARCDMIIERSEGILEKVQVKTARMKGSFIEAASSSSALHRGGCRSSYKGQVDLMAFYCPSNDKVYVISVEDCPESFICFRLTPPLNGQVKGVRFASDFEV